MLKKTAIDSFHSNCKLQFSIVFAGIARIKKTATLKGLVSLARVDLSTELAIPLFVPRFRHGNECMGRRLPPLVL
jgi:hypothetical protein